MHCVLLAGALIADAAGAGEGARAAGVTGALFGVLLLASSLMWALYKFKPGLLAGAGPAGSGETGPLIGAPRNNLGVVQPAGPGYVYAPKVDINGAAGMAMGEAHAGTQTLQTMNALDLGQFADAGAASGVNVFFYGGGVASRATQTMMTSYGASLFNQQMSSSSMHSGYGNSWGSGAAATSTLRETHTTTVYDRSVVDGVYESGGVVSEARAPRSTFEMGTMTVSNAGTQTAADLGGGAAFEQVDYMTSSRLATNTLQSASGSAFNAVDVVPLPPARAQPVYHHQTLHSSSSQTQTYHQPPGYHTLNDGSAYYQGQGRVAYSQGHGGAGGGHDYSSSHGYGSVASYNNSAPQQNTQSAFNYNVQVSILLKPFRTLIWLTCLLH